MAIAVPIRTQNPAPFGECGFEPHPRYYKSASLSYHNGTTTRVSPCPFIGAGLPIKALFCLPVSLGVSLSLSGSDYESRRRFESCRARYQKPCKSQENESLRTPPMGLYQKEQRRNAAMERIASVSPEGALAVLMMVSHDGCVENSLFQNGPLTPLVGESSVYEEACLFQL
jgi:hypothetical protein